MIAPLLAVPPIPNSKFHSNRNSYLTITTIAPLSFLSTIDFSFSYRDDFDLDEKEEEEEEKERNKGY